jgi:multimeric flavodoxin WrbA
LKVVAFNGSAHKDGNTAMLIRRVFGVLESEGIETELFQLAGEQIRGCTTLWNLPKNQKQRMQNRKPQR